MSGEAVLVVKHEEPSREFLAQQLTGDGFEVFADDRAGQALELVEAEHPDLVLLDAVGTPSDSCGRSDSHTGGARRGRTGRRSPALAWRALRCPEDTPGLRAGLAAHGAGRRAFLCPTEPLAGGRIGKPRGLRGSPRAKGISPVPSCRRPSTLLAPIHLPKVECNVGHFLGAHGTSGVTSYLAAGGRRVLGGAASRAGEPWRPLGDSALARRAVERGG
jgi:hypothetical protein